MVNDLHFQTDVATLGEEPPANDVLDSFDTHFTTAYRACIPASSTLDSLEAREEVTPGSGSVPISGSKVKGVAGTLAAANQNLPDAATLILKLRTEAAIRSGRGYLAMPSPKDVGFLTTNGRWLTSGAFWTAIQAFAALMDDSFSTAGAFPANLNPVIYSRTRAARSEDPHAFRVVEGVPSTPVRWRRSRTTTP